MQKISSYNSQSPRWARIPRNRTFEDNWIRFLYSTDSLPLAQKHHQSTVTCSRHRKQPKSCHSNDSDSSHCCRAWIVQSYSPSGAHMYSHVILISLGLHESAFPLFPPKCHHHWFSRFCRTHSCDRCTDTQTTKCQDMKSNSLHLVLYAALVMWAKHKLLSIIIS